MNAGAMIGCRFDGNIPLYLGDALLHDGQADVMSVMLFIDRGIKTHTVIANEQVDVVFLMAKIYQYLAGFGMFPNIGQGFLHDEHQL